jgi:FKBP-type peptidyl-prolyl cis-trans isomerase SlyD
MRAQIISFRCELRNRTGDLISSTVNREVLTHAEGDEPAMLPALVEGLRDLREGERRRILLTADRAYGFYDPKLVTECPRSDLSQGAELRMGDEVRGRIHSGRDQIYRVIGVSRHAVTLDGNHPLAGQDLVFDIETLEARDATDEDLAEGTVAACEALPGVH